MAKKTLYCPYNGRHGMINGAAMPHRRSEGCKSCGYPPAEDVFADTGLTTHNQYCPQCFRCLTCERVIKRKFYELQDKRDSTDLQEAMENSEGLMPIEDLLQERPVNDV